MTKQMQPDGEETQSDFMDRCTAAGHSKADCQTMWDNEMASFTPQTVGRAYSTIKIKSVDESQRIIEGIASTPTADRMEDVVEPLGAQFKLPMPLLWQHDSKQPIGTVLWAEASATGIPFKAMLAKSLEPGRLKDRLDEAWQSIKLGLVRAVSIGFKTLDAEPVDEKNPWGGTRFKKWEWLELSAVTIPANIDASINVIRSIDTIARAASGTNWEKQIESMFPPASGQTKSQLASQQKSTVKALEPKTMKKSIAEQISAFEATRAAKAARRDELMDLAADKGETLDSTAKEEHDTLEGEIKEIDDHLVRLRRREAENKSQAVVVNAGATPDKPRSSVITVAQKKLEPATNFFRYCQVMMMSKGNKFEAVNYVQQNDRWMHESPELVDILRTSVAVGTTTEPSWAGNLVQYQVMVSEFIELLRAQTVLDRLTGFRRVPFNINVPRQTAGTSVNWVGEGQPKPLTKGAFDTVQLRWSKIAGIVAFTQELVRFSNPSAEAVIRTDLTAAVAQFIDEQFLDPSKGEVANVSPASITNGADTAAASGETALAFRNDLKLAIGNFALDNINLSGVVMLMTPLQAVSLGFMVNTTTSTPEFPGLVASGGNILGFPVITSNNVPSGTIILLKPGEILLADDGGVDVAVSTEASLQMDDDPSSGEQQVVSLWQSNLIGLRVERFINWKVRRPNAVYVITGADYGGIGTGT